MRALGQRDAAVDAEQLRVVSGVAVLIAGLVAGDACEILVGGLFLERDRDVVDQVGKALGKRLERFLNDPLELVEREMLVPQRSRFFTLLA